jgi:serine protease
MAVLVCGLAGVPGARADVTIVDTPTGAVVSGEVLVKFAGAASWYEAQLYLAPTGGTVVDHGAGTDYYRVLYPRPGTALVAAQVLSAQPRVYEATPNHVCFGGAIGTSPTAPLPKYQWNLAAMQLDAFAPAPRADGVVVAVLDTGVAFESYADALGTYAPAPDLAGVEFVPGYDFINGDAHPNDDQRHGTHVTAVIAATHGTTPMVRGVAIMPLKVLDGGDAGTELALAEAIVFAADHGADVINMSLAFSPGYFPSRLLQEAVDHAAQKGVIMVAAAGNAAASVVAYPAAFRDVIAVGASGLHRGFHTHQNDWRRAFDALDPAPYQNHGFKLDVLAPGGLIDGDANRDGFPEAVLAQTFVAGHPTQFAYTFFAGTSQAAAQVTGLVAAMKAADPTLDAFRARALLTETAGDLDGWLSEETGRGRVRAPAALRATRPTAGRGPRYFADPIVSLHDRGHGRTEARASVEILGQDGRPVRFAFVFGTFTGGANDAQVAFTGFDGVARFVSPTLDGEVVAFQVDAVAAFEHGLAFDRPQGFIRIDAVSLAMLAAFGDGIGTSPTGIGTSPTLDDGAGVGTSPTLATGGTYTPMTIGYDPRLFAGTHYRRTLLLPNFSWALATEPMAVAVDEAWFLDTFPDAAGRRVVSHGRGLAGSPFRFDASSFPSPVTVPAGGRLPLVVLTYTSGIGTSPTGIGTSPTGIGTSPTGIGTSPTGIVVEGAGVDAASARAMTATLSGWYLHAAGLGAAPTWDPAKMSRATFDQLGDLFHRYIGFATLDVAQPVTSYGSALDAAGMSVAPAGDGRGAGER